jgi:addiction module HigA family antidote
MAPHGAICTSGAEEIKTATSPANNGGFVPAATNVRAVAMALHVPYSRLSEIIKGQRGVSADTALRLERYFGSEAKGWLNLQAAYELRVAEIENGKAIAKEIQPIALAA